MRFDCGDSGPPAGCEPLPWDTAHWGFPVARVTSSRLSPTTLASIDSWCRANQIRCLYYLREPDDDRSRRVVEDDGFQLVDERLTYQHGLAIPETTEAKPAVAELRIRPYAPGDLTTLRRIARTSYHDTRFYVDGRFSPERCDRLYEIWIERSCAGWADRVLVVTTADTPIGYVTCHLDGSGTNSSGQIGLVGVQADQAGRGVGSRLVREALQWFREAGASSVTVVTQARNGPARRLYERCGFTLDATHVWYHKWFPPVAG